MLWVLGFVMIDSCNLFSDSLMSKKIFKGDLKVYLGITLGIAMERKNLLFSKN
jgi:hypothetical protein